MAEERAIPVEEGWPGRRLSDLGSLPWTQTDTLLSTLLALAIALVFAQTLRFDFVMDDLQLIVHNPLVLTPWRALPRFFAEGLFARLSPNAPNNMYRPMFSVWLVFNHWLWGFNPAGWHLMAVLLLALNILGVYALGRRLLHDRSLAALATALFALHPIHVESTAWIIGTNEALMVAPFIGSFLAYLRSRDASRLRKLWLGVPLVCFALALLVKEEAIVLPVLVAGFVWVYGRSSQSPPPGSPAARLGKALIGSIAFWALAAAYLAVRFEILHGLSHTATSVPFGVMVRTIPLILWNDVQLLAWPSRLAIFYDSPYVPAVTFSRFLLPLIFLLALAMGLAVWGRRSPSAQFAAIWTIVPVLPFLDLRILHRGDFIHDRWLYLSSIGFAMLLAMAIRVGAQRLRPAGVCRPLLKPIAVELVVGVVLGSAYGGLSFYDSRFWTNEPALFTHAAAVSPGSDFALDGLAHQYAQRGQCAAVSVLDQTVLARSPRYWAAYFNLGVCRYITGGYEDALNYLGQASVVAPDEPELYFYIGLAQYQLGHLAVAETSLRRAVEFSPDGRGYHLALGMVLEAEGDPAQALAEFRQELANHPSEPAALRKIAELRARTHQISSSAALR